MRTTHTKFYLGLFLGASSLLCIENSFASNDPRSIGDINVSASGTARVIGHADRVTTESLTQNQGGQGGHAVLQPIFNLGSSPAAHVERELSPLENYQQGERYLREIPPRENEAIECFQRAAGAKPDPHIDACIKCAELYLKKENFQQSAKYYSWALGLIEKDPYQKHLADSIYSGLMKLDLFIGKKARDVARKESHFLKARDFGNKIDYPGEDDEDIIETINKELAALNISKVAKASSSGSEVDGITRDSEKVRLVELEKLSKREADLLEAERKIAEDRRHLETKAAEVEHLKRSIEGEAQRKAVATLSPIVAQKNQYQQ